MKRTLLLVGLVSALLVAVIAADRAVPSGTADTETIADLRGKPLDMKPYAGKVVLVNFWATWCAPCLIEIPWMIEFHEKYAGRGFVVAGIAMDEEGRPAVEPWVKEKTFEVNGQKRKINYPLFIGNEAVAEAYGGLLGLPTTLIVNREGKPVKRFIGITSHEKFAAAIEEVLGPQQ
jgi:thiol-disulfide isomerase/thioredoxin